METPLPTRRITRSQASILAVKNQKGLKNEESNNGVMKSRQKKNQEKEKSALIDITNGSPIVGLAMGSLRTPSSRCSKKRMVVSNSESKSVMMTPGSGESLLRGQVKTLLQKVEEESLASNTCFDHNVWCRNPANTPLVFGFSNSIVSPVDGNYSFNQMLDEVIAAPNQEDKGESAEKNVITRSLFSDFSEKSHDSDASECNSLMTSQDSNESQWSVQVNASTSDECKEYEEDVVVDELCEGMSKMSVNKGVKFTGKHIRFVYNSDGELEGKVLSASTTDTRRKSFEVCSGM
ncbi:hypothetical protein Hdeb2414_s0012g00383091 [Helianthus debilis subsp. tardiflorus]